MIKKMTSVTKVFVVKNGTCGVVPGFPIDGHIYRIVGLSCCV